MSSEVRDGWQDVKLLGGMLALRRFTIAELAAYAGVPEGSTRSFLSRHSDLVVEDKKIPATTAGRRATRRRLTEVAAETVAEKLRALRGQLIRDLGPDPEVETSLGSEPRSLGLLEQIVGRLTTEDVSGDERQSEIEEAQLQKRLTVAALDDREEVLGRSEPELHTRLSKASSALEKQSRKAQEPKRVEQYQVQWPPIDVVTGFLEQARAMFGRYNMKIEPAADAYGGAPMVILDVGSQHLANSLMEYCESSGLPVLSLSLHDLDEGARGTVARYLGELLFEPAGAGCGVIITAQRNDPIACQMATSFLHQAERVFADTGVDFFFPDPALSRQRRYDFDCFYPPNHERNWLRPHVLADEGISEFDMRELRVTACRAAIVRRAADIASLRPGAKIYGHIRREKIGATIVKRMFPEPVFYIEGSADAETFFDGPLRIRAISSDAIGGSQLIDELAIGV